MERVPVEKKVLKKNDELAAENRQLFEHHGLVAVNVMSAPGAGKTSVLERILPALKSEFRPAVIEGDLYTTLDAQRIEKTGVPAYQITTGTCCHLDAKMIAKALTQFPLGETDLLIIENVGNMVCPAEFDLGEDLRVMVFSAVEGAEKPQKYPLMFRTADAVILNKTDLIPYSGVSLHDLVSNVVKVNPTAPVFAVSCRTGEGLAEFAGWLMQRARSLHKREVSSCV
jgi:hydrogenase nickel incorporation protein HypB